MSYRNRTLPGSRESGDKATLYPALGTMVASAFQTRVTSIQNCPLWVWDGIASSQYIAVGPRTSISVQFHKCIPFQLHL